MTKLGLSCHFIWIGRDFPYYCRLAVESVVLVMPDATVHLHVVGDMSGSAHFASVTRHQQVVVHRFNPAESFADCPSGSKPYIELIDRIPNASPAGISNLVRLAVLHRMGGVYLDTDVLLVRPLCDPDRYGAYVGVERVWADNRDRIANGMSAGIAMRSVPWAVNWALRRLDCKLANGRWGVADRSEASTRSTRLQVNNAVIGAPARSEFIEAALLRALEVDPTKRFALGPSLLDDVVRELPRTVDVAPTTRFYAIPPSQSYRYFEDRHLELPPDADLIHYVSSNHRSMLHSLDHDDDRFDHAAPVFWRLAREVRDGLAERDRQLSISIGSA